MEIFGFCALSVKKTAAGSLELKQQATVPLQHAHRASKPFIYLDQLDWKASSGGRMVAIDNSHGGACEILEELSRRPATELMTSCQALSNPRQLNQAKKELGFSSEDLIIPYNETPEAREKWQAMLDFLLRQSKDISTSLKKLGWVGDREATRRWLKKDTLALPDGRRVIDCGRRGLDLITPDFSRRYLLSGTPPWVLVERADRTKLKSFRSRQEMICWVEERLQTAPGDPRAILNYLKDSWKGQPLDAEAIDVGTRGRLGLTVSELMTQAERGYVCSSSEGLEDEHKLSLAPRTLPGGLFHPGLAPVQGRPAPRGRIQIKAPRGLYQ